MSSQSAGTSLESVTCAVCGSSDSVPATVRPPREARARSVGLEAGRSRWVVCRDCGLVFQNPRPTQDVLDRLYVEGEYHQQRGGVPDHYVAYSLRRPVPSLHWLMDELHVLPPTGRALDIGCGIGGSLVYLRDRGWEGVGVEPDPLLRQTGKDRFGVDIRPGYFDADTFPEDFTVDFVYSCHVFEHLADPEGVSAAAHRVLATREGYLLIVVPTFRRARSLAWTYFGMAHMYMFTHVSLGNVLRKAGFDYVDHRYEGASGDSELWLLARARQSRRENDLMIHREPVSPLRRELALVPLRVPLGVPSRARRHIDTFRKDPADFGRRVRRRLSFQLRRVLGLLRSN